MAKKSKTYWAPDAKGHLAAAHLLSKNAPHLSKSAPVVQRKVASFRAAAKAQSKVAPIPKLVASQAGAPSKLTQPPAGSLPPAGVKPLGTKPATPLKTSLPPKLPGG